MPKAFPSSLTLIYAPTSRNIQQCSQQIYKIFGKNQEKLCGPGTVGYEMYIVANNSNRLCSMGESLASICYLFCASYLSNLPGNETHLSLKQQLPWHSTMEPFVPFHYKLISFLTPQVEAITHHHVTLPLSLSVSSNTAWVPL